MYDLSYNLNEPDDVHTMMQKAVGMRPITVVEMDGGMVAKVSRVDVRDGTTMIAKHDPGADAHLEIEAEMLRNLRTPDVIRVPDVYFESRHLLVQEFIAGAHLEPATREDACRKLAAVHEVTLPKARLRSTTLDGWIEIPSRWTDSWIEFFDDHRLRFAADAALAACNLSVQHWDRAQLLALRLGDLLVEAESLLASAW